LLISSRRTWTLDKSSAKGKKVGSPLGHTNFIVGLLWLESKFDSTLLPLKLASKDGTGQGGKTRDKSTRFWLDLKKKGNTLSIVLHFPVDAIKNYIMRSCLAHKKNLKSP